MSNQVLHGPELALPAWGLPDYSLHFSSSAYAGWPAAAGGAAAAAQLQPAGAGLGSADYTNDYGLGLPYYSLDQLPGDASKLSEVLAAAAALGTPPLPPRGSRFDDMDSVSGSAAAAAPLLGSSAPTRQQQHRIGRHHERQIVLTRGAGSSGRLAPAWSLGQLAAAGGSSSDGGVPDAAAAAVVAEHLDGLLGGLSLLGERAPGDVGQELAVAHSVHQVGG